MRNQGEDSAVKSSGSRLQVVVEEIQVDNVPGIAPAPPEFGGSKFDGITVLGLVFQSMGHPIRKRKHSMIDVHLSPMSSHVSGVPGVASGMLIFYPHPVAHLKSGRNVQLHSLGT